MAAEEEVKIFRYDISGGGAQSYGAIAGMELEAVWHTSVVVFGTECYYVGGGGVLTSAPYTTQFGEPVREESLGTTKKTREEFETFNREVEREKFGPDDYNMFNNNCNNYTHEALLFLTGQGAPDDVINMIPNMMESPLGRMVTPIAEAVMQFGAPIFREIQRNPQMAQMAAGIPKELPKRDYRARNCPNRAPARYTSKSEARVEELDSDYEEEEEDEDEEKKKKGRPQYFHDKAKERDSHPFRDDPSSDAIEVVEPVRVRLPPGQQPTIAETSEMSQQHSPSALQVWLDSMAGMLSDSDPERLAVALELITSVTLSLATQLGNSPRMRVSETDFLPLTELQGGTKGLLILGFEKDRQYFVFCRALLQRPYLQEMYALLQQAAEDAAVAAAIKASAENADQRAPQQSVTTTAPATARSYPEICGQLWLGIPPRSRPLTSLEELLSWDGTVSSACPSQPLRKRRLCAGERAVMVIHDFKGGYMEDAAWEGERSATCQPCFTFAHWDYITHFVYFSHYLVTIPPPCWIASAHGNGVSIFGTIFSDSPQFWPSLLGCSAPGRIRATVAQLVKLCTTCGFDGWFIAAHNASVEPKHFASFISQLSTELKRSVGAHAGVYVFDTIGEGGAAQPQFGVTDANEPVFESCDGFVAHYDKFPVPSKHSEAAKCKLFGCIDVFGRGTEVAGKFETAKSAAQIIKQGLSVCLFAPGWTLEKSGASLEGFARCDAQLWRELKEILPQVCQPVATCVSKLPFCTFFNAGQGKKEAVAGVVRRSEPFFQMDQFDSYFARDCSSVATVDFTKPYNGGSSLHVTPRRSSSPPEPIKLVDVSLSEEEGSEQHSDFHRFLVVQVITNNATNCAWVLQQQQGASFELKRHCYEFRGGDGWVTRRFAVELGVSNSMRLASLTGIAVTAGGSPFNVGCVSVSLCRVARSGISPLSPLNPMSPLGRQFLNGADPTSLLAGIGVSVAAAYEELVLCCEIDIPAAVAYVNVFVDEEYVGRCYSGYLHKIVSTTGRGHRDPARELEGAVSVVGFQAVHVSGVHGSIAKRRLN